VRHLQYKKVSYHRAFRTGRPPRVKVNGKSTCPAINQAAAEALLNRGFRMNVNEDGYPGQVFVKHNGQWYKAHGGLEGSDGPYYHGYPVLPKHVPDAARRKAGDK
jgi:hypothetical protein